MTDTEKGIYHKFNVTRVDGSSGPGGKHENCEYFILDITHDKYAVPALEAYADACIEEYTQLGVELKVWVSAQKMKKRGSHD